MRIIRKVIDWFRNSSLNQKILILVLAVGVLPIGIIFMVSLAELKKISREQQLYAVNQGYTQVFQALETQIARVYNLSTLLTVNDQIGSNIMLSRQSENIAEQMAHFEDIHAYINGMEIAFESNNVVFYMDKALLAADSQVGRFRAIVMVKHFCNTCG